MNRFAWVMAVGVLALGVAGTVHSASPQGDEKKDSGPENRIKDGPKADVIVKGAAKTASAKAGQLVEVAIGRPLSPPFPSDFEVTVDGKKAEAKDYLGDVFFNGKPVPGTTVNLVHIKAEGEGKQKVVIQYKQGTQKLKRELELEVTK